MSTTQQPPPTTGVDDAFAAVLMTVRAELADLIDVPTWSLDDVGVDDRFAQAAAVRAAADEVMARLVGEMETRGLAQRAGASSTHSHLVATHRMSSGEGARLVHASRQLHASSALAEPTRRAQACGALSSEQAVVIAGGINRLTTAVDPAGVAAMQSDLIGHAARLSYRQLRQLVNHAVELVDPDAADATIEAQLRRQEEAARAGTEFVLRIGPDGVGSGRFHHLPALQAAMLKTYLDSLASPRRPDQSPDQPADRSVEQGPGPDPTRPDAAADATAETTVEAHPDRLPYASRMGQAFIELVERLPVHGHPQHGITTATLVVRLDEAALRDGTGRATTDTGEDVSVSEVRRLACNAGIIPLVLGGRSQILDLGMSRRLFTRSQRLALAERDLGCVFPGCQRSPTRCEAHHRIPWRHGGPTDLANGCLLCSFHHHLIHQGEWDLTLAPDGIVEVVPPARIDSQRRPIRHQRLRPRAG